VVGGTLFMVTKRELWYRNKITSVFGGVRVREVDGYFVFEATKKSSQYAAKALKPRPRERRPSRAGS
jgi:16S rRNA (guanine1207-N2)-methyltransferase